MEKMLNREEQRMHYSFIKSSVEQLVVGLTPRLRRNQIIVRDSSRVKSNLPPIAKATPQDSSPNISLNNNNAQALLSKESTRVEDILNKFHFILKSPET